MQAVRETAYYHLRLACEARVSCLQEGEIEKHRIHDLILQADSKQQQVQDSIAARPRGGARDELISELIQSRLAVSRAQMNAEAGVSEQMIEEQQEVIAWLWRILEHAGMTQAQVSIMHMMLSELFISCCSGVS